MELEGNSIKQLTLKRAT